VIEEPRNLLTEWSHVLAASLVSAGVREVVVSPGSRSTPFLLALRERRELRLTSVIDERAAAFVALGMGRATGGAAAVLATSGTAPAHWLPAVIEASLTNVPMLLLSANRPLALCHTGAAQTIDQTKLFGDWVRLFVDIGDPRAERSAFESLARSVGQAIAVANAPSGGPVHVDLHADKPLEPIEASSDDELALVVLAAEVAARGVTRVTNAEPGGDESFARDFVLALSRSKRPLVVLGPRRACDDTSAIRDACDALDVVVAAEATSQLRFGPRPKRAIDASEILFADARFAREHVPDLVLQIGSLPTAPTLERAWSRATRFVLDAGGIHDPLGGAVAISLASAGIVMKRIAELAAATSRDVTWQQSLQCADAIAWSEVERSISTGRGEGPVVRAALVAAAGATLVVGNSLPIRTVDRFVPGGGPARRVISQRGANGIDGLVSGAIGVAIADASPVLAIVGDVSFVHDMHALAIARELRSPLVVVVVDNGGGRIFESLPIANVAAVADAMPLFTTPHGIDLALASRAFGVPCIETRNALETSRAVASAMTTPGLTVVRAIVDADDARKSFQSLVSGVGARVHGATP